MDGRARKLAIREFLVERRGRLRPEDVGLTAVGRRRVPGLRREEVADLAHISTVWYTLLETGRDIRVSPRMLDRLSAALRLDEQEKAYLFSLAINELPVLGKDPADTVGAVGQEYFELARFVKRSQAASGADELAEMTTELVFALAEGAKIAYFVEADLAAKKFNFLAERTSPGFKPVGNRTIDFSNVHDADAVLVRGEVFTECNVGEAPHAVFRERAIALGSGRYISAGIKSDAFSGAVGYFEADRDPYSERERSRLMLVTELVTVALTKHSL